MQISDIIMGIKALPISDQIKVGYVIASELSAYRGADSIEGGLGLIGIDVALENERYELGRPLTDRERNHVIVAASYGISADALPY